SLAAITASSIASRCSGVGVPRLTKSPLATRAKEPDSPTISVMAGAAPMANKTLAVKLGTTEFVMHCTSGWCARSLSSNTALGERLITFNFLQERSQIVPRDRTTSVIPDNPFASPSLVRFDGCNLSRFLRHPVSVLTTLTHLTPARRRPLPDSVYRVTHRTAR